MDTRVRSRIEPVGAPICWSALSARSSAVTGPAASPCRRMLADGDRALDHDKPAASIDETALVETIVTISDSFEA